MKVLVSKLKNQRLSISLVHGLLQAILPLMAFILVSLQLTQVALALVLISKWRVLAVKARYWAINFRTNIIDILFGFSVVEFMSQVSFGPRLIWLMVYLGWVFYVKKLSNYPGMLLQASLTQALAISALIYNNQSISLWVFMVGVWFISYFSARHVLASEDDNYTHILAQAWGLVAVQLAWILGHWQIWYLFVHQIVLLLTVGLVALSTLFHYGRQENIQRAILRQISVSAIIIVAAVLFLSDWTEKTI